MNSVPYNIYTSWKIFSGHTINLGDSTRLDPWIAGLLCLKAIEYKDYPDKKLLLPFRSDLLLSLKRMHLDTILRDLTYSLFLERLEQMDVGEKEDPNIHEIFYCEFRDEFEGRLSSGIRTMLKNFGLSTDDEYRMAALIGELGNNVFDHNDGLWPTSVRGALILAQRDSAQKQLEIVVADPGVGFRESLKVVDPSIANDIQAIQLGLSGVTGRVGELRGNGLRFIQDWIINKFDGILKIHSGSGLVMVDKDGQSSQTVFPILGTLASLVIHYK